MDYKNPQFIAEDNLAQAERDFEQDILTAEKREEIWKELHSYFRQQSAETDWEFRYDYFRWYALLTWRHLSELDRDVLLEEVLGKQFPEAILVSANIMHELLMYSGIRVIQNEAQREFFYDAQRALLTSKAIIGITEDGPVRVVDLAEQIVSSIEAESWEQDKARFIGELQKLLFPADKRTEYFQSTPAKAAERMVDTLHFFLVTDPADIPYIVYEIMNPDAMKQTSATQETKEDAAPSSQATTMTMPQIKAMIEERFTPDKNGDIQNIDGVLMLLHTLADEYNNPQILELYFFDEKQGQFVWNQDLLK